jgi:hypothetical protein
VEITRPPIVSNLQSPISFYTHPIPRRIASTPNATITPPAIQLIQRSVRALTKPRSSATPPDSSSHHAAEPRKTPGHQQQRGQRIAACCRQPRAGKDGDKGQNRHRVGQRQRQRRAPRTEQSVAGNGGGVFRRRRSDGAHAQIAQKQSACQPQPQLLLHQKGGEQAQPERRNRTVNRIRRRRAQPGKQPNQPPALSVR